MNPSSHLHFTDGDGDNGKHRGLLEVTPDTCNMETSTFNLQLVNMKMTRKI